MATLIEPDWRLEVPEVVRRQLDLAPGAEVVFAIRADGGVEISRATRSGGMRESLDKWLGAAAPGLATDEVMALTRGST